MKIALMIFTRNEKSNSERIFPRIPFEIFDGVYVVDGNSTDGTQDFWRKKKIKVYGQKYKGVGGAYEASFRKTKEDALVFFHPDGNSDPKTLPKIVKILKQKGEIVIPSRMIRGSVNEEDENFLKPRKWFGQLLALLANIVWGRSGNICTDVCQGYRGISRDAYNRLNIKVPDPIAPDYEQVIRALKNNVQISEINTKEGNRIDGVTAFSSFDTGIKNLKVFFRELF